MRIADCGLRNTESRTRQLPFSSFLLHPSSFQVSPLLALSLLFLCAACGSPSFKIPSVVDHRARVPGSLKRKPGYKAAEQWQVDYNRSGRSRFRVTLRIHRKEKEALEAFRLRRKAHKLAPSRFDGADLAGARAARLRGGVYTIVLAKRYRFTVEFIALKGVLTRSFVEDFLRKAIPP